MALEDYSYLAPNFQEKQKPRFSAPEKYQKETEKKYSVLRKNIHQSTHTEHTQFKTDIQEGHLEFVNKYITNIESINHRYNPISYLEIQNTRKQFYTEILSQHIITLPKNIQRQIQDYINSPGIIDIDEEILDILVAFKEKNLLTLAKNKPNIAENLNADKTYTKIKLQIQHYEEKILDLKKNNISNQSDSQYDEMYLHFYEEIKNNYLREKFGNPNVSLDTTMAYDNLLKSISKIQEQGIHSPKEAFHLLSSSINLSRGIISHTSKLLGEIIKIENKKLFYNPNPQREGIFEAYIQKMGHPKYLDMRMTYQAFNAFLTGILNMTVDITTLGVEFLFQPEEGIRGIKKMPLFLDEITSNGLNHYLSQFQEAYQKNPENTLANISYIGAYIFGFGYFLKKSPPLREIGITAGKNAKVMSGEKTIFDMPNVFSLSSKLSISSMKMMVEQWKQYRKRDFEKKVKDFDKKWQKQMGEFETMFAKEGMIDEITKIKNYYQLLLARNQELSAKNKILQEKIHGFDAKYQRYSATQRGEEWQKIVNEINEIEIQRTQYQKIAKELDIWRDNLKKREKPYKKNISSYEKARDKMFESLSKFVTLEDDYIKWTNVIQSLSLVTQEAFKDEEIQQYSHTQTSKIKNIPKTFLSGEVLAKIHNIGIGAYALPELQGLAQRLRIEKNVIQGKGEAELRSIVEHAYRQKLSEAMVSYEANSKANLHRISQDILKNANAIGEKLTTADIAKHIQEYHEKFKRGELKIVTIVPGNIVQNGVVPELKSRYQVPKIWQGKEGFQAYREQVDKRLNIYGLDAKYGAVIVSEEELNILKEKYGKGVNAGMIIEYSLEELRGKAGVTYYDSLIADSNDMLSIEYIIEAKALLELEKKLEINEIKIYDKSKICLGDTEDIFTRSLFDKIMPILEIQIFGEIKQKNVINHLQFNK